MLCIFKSKILIIIFLSTKILADTGSIIGEVVDADSHQPIIGANILIYDTKLGTACDIEGRFIITEIPVGSYKVVVSMIGYTSASRVNVNVYSNRHTPLKFYLNKASLEGDIVIVKESYFQKAKDGIISTQTMDVAEIRSDPSGAFDIQKMIQALPSVSMTSDQNNEIIVRGGGAGENLFIMDHLEIPNPNHFGKVGTGGGAINMINTEFVERVDFFAGGYPVRYGDKQSSVMDISLREGSPNDFLVDMEISMGGMGFLAEGPLCNDKGSFIASYRKAFLKYIVKKVGITAIPEYSNMQTKLVYNLDKRNKLIFNVLSGQDYLNMEDEDNPLLQGAENIDHTGNQYSAGLTYKSLFSKKGYSLFSLGHNTTRWTTDVYRYKIDNLRDNYFNRDNIEKEYYFKSDIIYRILENIELSSGFSLKYGLYQINEIAYPDTVYSYLYDDLDIGLVYNEEISNNDYYNMVYKNIDYNYYKYQITSINDSINNFDSGGIWKFGTYSQIKFILNRLSIIAGLRYDKVPYNNTAKISPRAGFSYKITPITKINFSSGYFYQTPAYWILMNPKNQYRLKHSYAYQDVIGLEHLFSDDIRGTIEIYNKLYYNKPILNSLITPEKLDERLGFSDIGKGSAKGIEIFLQKKFAEKWYGAFSYSLSSSSEKDPRPGRNDYYPSDYDYRKSLTIIGGYKFNFRDIQWYQKVRANSLFPYIAWMPFMIADRLEISFRYSFNGGRPYTPKKYDFRHRRWYIDPADGLNTVRYNNYSRFDIMILRRFNFKTINLTTYFDLQNIFDRDNEWEKMYLEDGSYKWAYHYKQIPVMGIIIEF